MLTQNLGYPRIGVNRDLKKVTELYWNGDCSKKELIESISALKVLHWTKQKECGMDLIPSNDFSLYDQVLDTALLVGALPDRYKELYRKEADKLHSYPIDTYFAMARGLQNEQFDIAAMEMNKWFNTNYHYLVPEFSPDQEFTCLSSKIFDEYEEAKSVGIITKPVLIGPVSFLLLGKEKKSPEGFHRLDLLDNLLPVYQNILLKLQDMGVEWVQIEEPFLALDIDEREKEAFKKAYQTLDKNLKSLKLILTTYFEGLHENTELACNLPAKALHIDLVEAPGQLDEVLSKLNDDKMISLGLVSGRNIWKTDLETAADFIKKAEQKLGSDRLIIAPSCSMLHCPVDLENENDETGLPAEVKQWMAFANQKLQELSLLKKKAEGSVSSEEQEKIEQHQKALSAKRSSSLVHNFDVQQRRERLDDSYLHRDCTYKERKKAQQEHLELPDLFPTTTIGSFPQTKEVRVWRSDFRQGRISGEEYVGKIKGAIQELIQKQEDIGLDVLVHGEFERNDMVEYFGEHFTGFSFTRNRRVQSYGTRVAKQHVSYRKVYTSAPVTILWTSYAQMPTTKQ